MRYDKPAKTFDEQADLLIGRGLIAERDQLVRRLRATSYFRLTGYLYPFRAPGGDRYQEGTTLEMVWRLYTFDQRLRTILLDAIEAIEVYVRTQLAYHFAHNHGPFAYTDPRHFPNLDREAFTTWQRKLDDQVQRSQRSREEFVVHFFDKYGNEHSRLPIWMLVELMDFGATLTFFRGIGDDIKKRLASEVGQPDRVVQSWMLALNTIRNRCAHHARLWNWELGTPILIPQERKFPDWHAPRLPNNRIGVILTVCRYWLNQISPTNGWSRRVFELFDEFPGQPLSLMGLPSAWRSHPLWLDPPSAAVSE
jgi:abortive infection bacteriophage resistance protein